MSPANIDLLMNGVLKGEPRSLARAITLMESSRSEDIVKAQDLLVQLMNKTKSKSLRIGISGSPGAGKSTFIEALGCYLVDELHLKVAVLAVDPTSPVSGGSLLGDKTRMELLSQKPQAFIRPSPSKGVLGGVSYKTRESILLCEAAGFDVVLVETVGVGQSEYEVRDMVDVFVLLALPNSGDELQGIKKGILELVDMVFVNKYDGDNKLMAQKCEAQLKSALSLVSHSSFEEPKVLKVSALNGSGVKEGYKIIQKYADKFKPQIETQRKNQNLNWLERLIYQQLKQSLLTNQPSMELWEQEKANVQSGAKTPYSVALSIIEKLKSSL